MKIVLCNLLLILWISMSYSQDFNIQKVVAADKDSNSCFGYSVSISGSNAIIGSYRDKPKGAAYIFSDVNDCWIEKAKLLQIDSTNGGDFGHSVSISNEFVVIGKHNDKEPNCAGAAYIYKNIDNKWTAQTKLTENPRKYTNEFGFSVSTSNDLVERFLINVSIKKI